MNLRFFGIHAPLLRIVLLLLLSPGLLPAQNPPAGSVKGQISDPSGASVPAARVAAVSSTGQIKGGAVHPDGTFEITGLAPGTYTLRARAKGFSPFEQASVEVAAGKTVKLNLALQIAQEVE